jgi:hypothetical protein
MSERDSNMNRLAVGFVMVVALFIYGFPKLVLYVGPTREVWKQFWLASGAVVPLVVLLPVVLRGSLRLRFASVLLCVFPCLVLYSVLKDHFR